METCETCKHFEDERSALDGTCLLSKSYNSVFMQSTDDICEYDPSLAVSKDFGCNQHKEK